MLTTRTIRMGFVLASMAVVGLVTLTACGGGEKLSGEPEVPDGYKTYRGKLATVAYPGNWTVEQRTTASGTSITEIQPSGSAPKPGIRLNEVADLRGTFDAQLAAQADVRKGTGVTGESTEDVELDGAERAVRFTGKATASGKSFDSKGLSVLTKQDGGVFLSAVAPAGSDDPDIDAIVESLRLNGS